MALPAVRIALIGDHDESVVAHRAIPPALALAGRALPCEVAVEWIHTAAVGDAPRTLAGFAGVWCVPASPYASMDGALNAIRFARCAPRAFLGTCGGFQHALIEFARNALGWTHADHAETNPGAGDPLVSPLSCSMVEVQAGVRPLPGTRLAAACGGRELIEGFHCRYGLNPKFRDALAAGGLRISAVDECGDARAVELTDHPFFVATLFQPERAALQGRSHPLVEAFVAACAQH